MVTRALVPLVLLGAALVGCTPELDDRAFLVDGPRLLAISSTPAEAAAGEAVTLGALYVDEHGSRDQGELDWAFCVARRALTDRGTVSPACLAPSGEGLSPIGRGVSVDGVIPMDACRLFGPDRPLPVDGEPAGRPVDPDPSGGYYQPVRLLVAEGEARYSVGATRISCGISGANADVAADYGARYRRNRSPEVASLSIVRDGVSGPFESVSPGAQVDLRAAWPPCPEEAKCGDGVCGIDEDVKACEEDCKAPKGCGGAERYVLFDPEQRSIVTKRESIRVSWFTTAGKLDEDITGRAADERVNESDNRWIAPSVPGPVRFWLVIRDDRGGIGFREHVVDVR